jgi:hypothetical protein
MYKYSDLKTCIKNKALTCVYLLQYTDTAYQ